MSRELFDVFFPHLSGLRIRNVLASGSTVRVHAEVSSVAARVRVSRVRFIGAIVGADGHQGVAVT